VKQLTSRGGIFLAAALLSTTVAMAEQNHYTSQGDRLKQELKDSTKNHPKRDMQTKPHNLQQGLKNELYGGSDTKGYKLDENGKDVPLN